MGEQKKRLSVFGFPKSGTTYLQAILDHHPQIMCSREGAFHLFGRALAHPVEEYHRWLARRDNARPHETLIEMLEFLGAESAPPVVESCVASARFTRMSGGRAPGQDDARSFSRKRIAGDWKEKMSKGLQRAVAEAGGRTLRQHGYT